jgi:hypothetical protein
MNENEMKEIIKKERLEEIVDAIEHASLSWTGWGDWTMVFNGIVARGVLSVEEILEKYTISRRTAEEINEKMEDYDAKAEEDADEATALGEEVIELLRKKEYYDALIKLKEACSLESNYGDDPSWGQPRRLLEDFIADLEEE